jgi:hypothetical protein
MSQHNWALFDGAFAMQVDHFVRFADDERQMPVVWHQTLLCFVQRYKVG